MAQSLELDDPKRVLEIRECVRSKPSLRRFYEEIYQKYAECLNRCPSEGMALELGSGAGFLKELLPEVITSDIIPYEGVDQVVDATAMPFEDQSLRAIFMLNVFHHIPDVGAFFKEAERCLVPNGRILLVDQFNGWLSGFYYKYLHHEPYDEHAQSWSFDSRGPLSDANGALAWIVFERDRQKFEREYPSLQMARYSPHSPFRYFLAGGLKPWSLLPNWAFSTFTSIDNGLVQISPKLASFVDIELVKK